MQRFFIVFGLSAGCVKCHTFQDRLNGYLAVFRGRIAVLDLLINFFVDETLDVPGVRIFLRLSRLQSLIDGCACSHQITQLVLPDRLVCFAIAGLRRCSEGRPSETEEEQGAAN